MGIHVWAETAEEIWRFNHKHVLGPRCDIMSWICYSKTTRSLVGAVFCLPETHRTFLVENMRRLAISLCFLLLGTPRPLQIDQDEEIRIKPMDVGKPFLCVNRTEFHQTQMVVNPKTN